ncbi:hypothetical protein IWQ62_004830 [Dispira parvispora]|uniref:Uncharacterized protein n=1 Tax=Dispira parvispora TaxID=1520584 RepID=A0A9W8E090_9FUNG|nr:hypothetical protein IWQ62_004830 [Dispira parvispora]
MTQATFFGYKIVGDREAAQATEANLDSAKVHAKEKRRLSKTDNQGRPLEGGSAGRAQSLAGINPKAEWANNCNVSAKDRPRQES